MADVKSLSHNQLKILGYISNLGRGVPRQEILKNLIPNATSLHLAIKPLDGILIQTDLVKLGKTKPSQVLSLTKRGKLIVEGVYGKPGS